MLITIRSSNAKSNTTAYVIATDGTVLVDNDAGTKDGLKILGFDVKEYIARYGKLDNNIDICDIGYLWERPRSAEHFLTTGDDKERGYEPPVKDFRDYQRDKEIEEAEKMLGISPTGRTAKDLKPNFHYVSLGPGCELMSPTISPNLIQADFKSMELRVAEHLAKAQPVAEDVVRPRIRDPLSDASCTSFGEVFLTVGDVLEIRPDLT